LARSCDAQGIFWDEPHFAMPIYPVGYQSTADWTCRCSVCQKLFEQEYGYTMPKVLTDQVKRFRRRKARQILQSASQLAKSIRPEWLVTQCSLPAENNYYLSYERGYDDWEQVAALRRPLSYSSAPRREDSSPGAQVQENSTTMDYELFRVSRRYRFYTADRPHLCR
jgi:hypothetical protein